MAPHHNSKSHNSNALSHDHTQPHRRFLHTLTTCTFDPSLIPDLILARPQSFLTAHLPTFPTHQPIPSPNPLAAPTVSAIHPQYTSHPLAASLWAAMHPNPTNDSDSSHRFQVRSCVCTCISLATFFIVVDRWLCFQLHGLGSHGQSEKMLPAPVLGTDIG
jgi:hypothetical protein